MINSPGDGALCASSPRPDLLGSSQAVKLGLWDVGYCHMFVARKGATMEAFLIFTGSLALIVGLMSLVTATLDRLGLRRRKKASS